MCVKDDKTFNVYFGKTKDEVDGLWLAMFDAAGWETDCLGFANSIYYMDGLVVFPDGRVEEF